MTNKMTKRDYFNAIKAIDEVAANADMVAFIDHEIELLDKKASNKKATKTQEENVGIKAEILSVLTSEGATVTDIQSKSDLLYNTKNKTITIFQ